GHDYFRSEVNGKGYLAPIESNFKTPQPISYLTDDKGDECTAFIKRHAGRPFFLFASFNAPHTPMQAQQEDLQLYAHIEDKKRRTYAAMVHRLDENVGKIVSALDSEGIREQTIIVFLSDNGGPSDSNASINAPFNGQKGILLEGGIHVPFILNWKGVWDHRTIDFPVSALDLTPTFLALAGESSQDSLFTGINLLPNLLDAKSTIPDRSLLWRFTISGAVLRDGWKLVRLPDRLPLLYHLPSDPSEQRNVSLDHLDMTQLLLRELGQWDVRQPHPVFLEGAVWKRRQLALYDKPYRLTQPR
ncbi:MAG: sulfatase-like hydrolase/transferase, partial [Saprospiraceae bacterium]|nr:sulfatase-like hydrolase/transferase [Saprospiraceae bacterium]